MNMESFDFAAAGFVIATFNLLNIPKVKEFIPPKIRHVIFFLLWVSAPWLMFRALRPWVLRDGWGTVLLWVVGGVVVMFGIVFIVAKISGSIWKKSTDDAIDP